MNPNYQMYNMQQNKCCPNMGCNNTTVTNCKPVVTCSKQVVNQYHITKQPYIHNYHTEIVHHHITENEYIPYYTCSEVHVNDGQVNR